MHLREEIGDLYDRAEVLKRAGQCAEAELILKQALEKQQTALGTDAPECAESLHRLAETAVNADDRATAEKAFRQFIAIKAHYLGVEGIDTAAAVQELVEVLFNWRRAPDAYKLITVFADEADKRHPKLGAKIQYLYLRARGLEGLGKSEQAARFANEACTLKRQFPPALGAFPKIYALLLTLAETSLHAGKYEDAFQALEEAHKLRYSKHQQEDTGYMNTLLELAPRFNAQGRTAQADTCLRLALDIAQTGRPWDREAYTTKIHTEMNAMAQASNGQKAQGSNLYPTP